MKINNYVWENDLSLNDLVLKQKERIEYLERSNNRREDEILELRQENADLDNVISELENIINKMMYEGYVDGTTSYYATTEHSEFGVRGKLLLEILKGEDNENIY